MDTPKCPTCSSEYTYELSDTTFGCSECGNEFTQADLEADKFVVLDSVGQPLADGDAVIIIQDLPVKGMPKPIKKGTKVKISASMNSEKMNTILIRKLTDLELLD